MTWWHADPQPDPRPDLTADGALWCLLLAAADAHDGVARDGCYALLHAARCEGARLAAGGPRLVLHRGEIDEPVWRDYHMPRLRERQEELWRLLTAAAT